jgi:AraC family transcriptional regulator, regulatory protein of adaptative response / DNA-3-methyladenine glycosylase II
VPGFSAVVTTCIYCRPGCPAQPRPENVRDFPLAAAAEAAGYRACLRCRPYRLQPQVMWTSSPELVCRAVRLILAGALDGGTEVELGARLGVSARHLRRLFAQHLGVTPDGLARSQRAHFARRMLDDTELSVVQVAYAAGFGSVRQLNRACRQVFRMSPSELRARRRATDRLVADGGLALRLSFQGQLDWDGLVCQLAARAVPGVEHVSGTTYRRTILLDGDPGVLELAPGGDDHLILTVHLPHWEELIHIVERARRIAGLDAESSGDRIPGAWDGFEAGVRAIAGRAVAGRLVERLGGPAPGLAKMGLTHTFPAPEALAGAELAGVPRGETVRAFARAVAEDAIRLDGSISLDRLLASLTAIDGLGLRTALEIALRLGEPGAYAKRSMTVMPSSRPIAESAPAASSSAIRRLTSRPGRTAPEATRRSSAG